MQWLAETEAITGYRSPLTRTFAPLSRASAAARGQPSAWPTRSGATHTSFLAGEARVLPPLSPFLWFFTEMKRGFRVIWGRRSIKGGGRKFVFEEKAVNVQA